ncbi:MAG TPA: DNA polymerase III subunit gamma/tau [Candidatus Pacearchaeota archaeon]|nr:DNA polymerase III subunit gamma/tau [Candidatus Parcubacteria bacterium]HOU45922.1 DNA polymerase III subunit gamma/tau [Candidatus Pacearchaeota archaeon]HPM08215.1 DNA polymerase III subunit gamma/tau [Candidatus Pacearchaeota archaeon]HQI74465.1 DNA polymerase III subunit gamma/tau [Candidatus Pacearchaeota archaeon]
MENLSLYRKYRPKRFDEIAGQEEIVFTLSNSIKKNMVAHAYLFCGPRGVGKTTAARVLAKAVNCLNPDGVEPCNKCANCLAINKGSAVDIIEIDAASNRGIDDIRELREGIKYSPTNLKYKVLIIDECHQLSKDAANALLKTLEEPPGHAIFILATTEIHKMIPTIISRCQRFDFRKVSVTDTLKRLKEVAKAEKIKIEDDALELIASNSQGSVRDAQVLLAQAAAFGGKENIKAEDIKNLLGLVDVKVLAEFFGFLVKGETKKSIEYLNSVFDKGYDPHEFSNDLINYLRQALLLKIDKSLINPLMANLTKEDIIQLNETIKETKEAFLHKALNVFMEAKNGIKFSPIPQLPLELAIIELIELPKQEK